MEVSDSGPKVKKIVEFFNKSIQDMKKLREPQRQMKLPELKLKQQDDPTR